MQRTAIGWTDFSSNPLWAVDKATQTPGWYCTRVSDGCRNCYAATLNMRWGNKIDYAAQNRDKVEWRLRGVVEDWRRLKKPSRIFVCDMTDLFHEDVPDDWITYVLSAMSAAKQHTYLVLTKRPERMLERVNYFCRAGWSPRADGVDEGLMPWAPLPNVQLGVSVENQETADQRIPLLLQTPAAVRWVSVEPMLEPVDLAHRPNPEGVVTSYLLPDAGLGQVNDGGQGEHIQWVVCGGESGPHHRPMDLAWALALQQQCAAAGVPFFFKQIAHQRPGQPAGDGYEALDAAKAVVG